MFNRIKYLWIWLMRMHHSSGFGVQSPNDYAFVREVINEHSAYYQYDELGKDDDWLTRKIGRLYFRIANWRQPEVIESDTYREYLNAGCNTAGFGKSSEMICISLNGCGNNIVYEVLDRVNDKTVLVVEGIYDSSETRKIWKDIVGDDRSRVTFDLYYCGIIFFDSQRFKTDYIVNF